jgi:hypothetical protein
MNEGTTITININITETLIIPIYIKAFGPFSFNPFYIELPTGTNQSQLQISSPIGQTGDFII